MALYINNFTIIMCVKICVLQLIIY